MNAAHIHLLLNHFPLIGAIVGLLLLSAAILRRSDELAKATFWLFVLVGAASVVVFLTGEPAEEAVEHVAGISNAMIEEHEEAALVATIAMGSAGVLALLSVLKFWRKPLPRMVVRGGFVAALVITGLMGYTANLGGLIRHTEIRATASGSGGSGEEHDEAGEK
jgi:uncharacterized membrane protein